MKYVFKNIKKKHLTVAVARLRGPHWSKAELTVRRIPTGYWGYAGAMKLLRPLSVHL